MHYCMILSGGLSGMLFAIIVSFWRRMSTTSKIKANGVYMSVVSHRGLMHYSLLLIRCIVHYNNLKSISVDYQFALILATGFAIWRAWLKAPLTWSFGWSFIITYKLEDTLDCFGNPQIAVKLAIKLTNLLKIKHRNFLWNFENLSIWREIA